MGITQLMLNLKSLNDTRRLRLIGESPQYQKVKLMRLLINI